MTNIFNISLHRSATQSAHDLFRRSSVSAIHWPAKVGGVDYQALAAGREDDPDFVAAILAPVIRAYKALSDVPLPALYRPLAVRYPQSKFFAFYRPAAGWVSSVRRHIQSRHFDPFERVVYWSYFTGKPAAVSDISDSALIQFHAWHHDGISAHFKSRGNFLLLSLEDTGLGPRLCAFCDRPPLPLRIVDYAKGHDPGVDPATLDAEICQ